MQETSGAGGGGALTSRGVLVTGAGEVAVDLSYLVEQDAPRILSVSIAGVPVLQGVVQRR